MDPFSADVVALGRIKTAGTMFNIEIGLAPGCCLFDKKKPRR